MTRREAHRQVTVAAVDGSLPRTGAKAASWTWWHQAAALAALLTVVCSPLAGVTFPPLVDYPNHLARMHLLFETGVNDPVRQFYEPVWAALPNLGMEAIMPLLLSFMDLESAGRAFVALTLALMASGVVALHHALHGRVSPWPLVAVLLLFNRILLWGFLNYLFGLALALWLLAFWIRTRGAHSFGRMLAFTLAATLLMYAHLFAFGFYALCLVVYEWGQAREDVRPSPTASRMALLTLLPPLLLFFALSPTREAVTWFEYGDPVRKLAAVGSLFNNYDRGLDTATFAIAAGLLGVALARGQLVLKQSVRLPLLVLIGGFCLMPGTVLTSQGADTRFAIGIAVLFIAATDLRLAEAKWRLSLVGLLVALLCVRTAVVWAHWRVADATYDSFTRSFAQLPFGSRLFTVDLHDTEWHPFPVPTAHIACLAVIERSAFVPTLFAFSTQQPVRMTAEYAALAARVPTAVHYRGRTVDWDAIRTNYSHLLLIDRGREFPVPGDYTLLAHSPDFRLYRTSGSPAALSTHGVHKP